METEEKGRLSAHPEKDINVANQETRVGSRLRWSARHTSARPFYLRNQAARI
jgi:hypothetical protein